MTNVLITGMSGLIGGVLKDRLISEGGYELTALNRSKVHGVKCVQADISDLEAIKAAFNGVDVVVHLAAYLGQNRPNRASGIYQDDWEGQLNGNIIGTYNVFEAARLAGVKRVVFASSGNVIRGFERDEPYRAISEARFDDVPSEIPMITHEMTRPHAIYGVAKVFGESLGRYYSDAHGMSFLCVRIGVVKQSNMPEAPRDRAIYLSHDDVTTMLKLCIDAPDDLKYDIFFATSNNKYSYRDISHAREVLGYEPKDSGDDFF